MKAIEKTIRKLGNKLWGLKANEKGEKIEMPQEKKKGKEVAVSRPKHTPSVAPEKSKPSSRKIRRKKPRQKKEIERICQVCQEWFIAYRSDHIYCSRSCKQKAYEKGKTINLYLDPAGHFQAKAMDILIHKILNFDGMEISKEEFDNWCQLVNFSHSLFIPYIPRRSYYHNFFKNQFVEFIRTTNLKYREKKSDSIILNIPADFEKACTRFINAFTK
ncbi:MAG: hypothetical protein R2764_22865 [Bacteroidales bacterium]